MGGLIRSLGSVLGVLVLLIVFLYILPMVGYLPPLRIVSVEVEGLSALPEEAVKEALSEIESSIITVDDEEILDLLVRNVGKRVKKVYLSREIRWEGSKLKVKVVERIPVAKVPVGKGFFLIDEEGVSFKPTPHDNLKNLITVKTYSLHVLEKNFPKIYKYVIKTVDKIDYLHVKVSRVVLRKGKLTLILPPAEEINEVVASRIASVMASAISYGTVDLRYDRFILVK